MTDPMREYERTANALVDLMADFLREHPEAIGLDSPFGLFDHGFDPGGLEPSLAQAQAAYARASKIVKDERS